MTPVRVQRKRTKGWRMPPNTVYVGRPTRWGNATRMDRETTAAEAVDWFAYLVSISPNAERWAAPLRGRNLACWCPIGQPCHADVLLELANA